MRPFPCPGEDDSKLSHGISWCLSFFKCKVGNTHERVYVLGIHEIQTFLHHETSHGFCYNNADYECLRIKLAGLLDVYYFLPELSLHGMTLRDTPSSQLDTHPHI